MTTYKPKIRTLRREPYHRVWHDTEKAKAGYCTVTGTGPPHRAKWSLLVRDSEGQEWWIAACNDHVPPDAEER